MSLTNSLWLLASRLVISETGMPQGRMDSMYPTSSNSLCRPDPSALSMRTATSGKTSSSFERVMPISWHARSRRRLSSAYSTANTSSQSSHHLGSAPGNSSAGPSHKSLTLAFLTASMLSTSFSFLGLPFFVFCAGSPYCATRSLKNSDFFVGTKTVAVITPLFSSRDEFSTTILPGLFSKLSTSRSKPSALVKVRYEPPLASAALSSAAAWASSALSFAACSATERFALFASPPPPTGAKGRDVGSIDRTMFGFPI